MPDPSNDGTQEKFLSHHQSNPYNKGYDFRERATETVWVAARGTVKIDKFFFLPKCARDRSPVGIGFLGRAPPRGNNQIAGKTFSARPRLEPRTSPCEAARSTNYAISRSLQLVLGFQSHCRGR